MSNVSYDPKMGKLPLDVFKAYAKQHHGASAQEAEKIHADLVKASKKAK